MIISEMMDLFNTHFYLKLRKKKFLTDLSDTTSVEDDFKLKEKKCPKKGSKSKIKAAKVSVNGITNKLKLTFSSCNQDYQWQ